MVAAYYRRLTHPDPKVQLEAAKAWSVWEGTTLSLRPDPDRIRLFGSDAYAIAFARIECHYFINKGFFERDAQLLEDAHRIREIPGTIVHGRYDVVTPLKNAWDLKRAWPEADLRSPASSTSSYRRRAVSPADVCHAQFAARSPMKHSTTSRRWELVRCSTR
jgi:proline iminopeptidase